MNSSTAGAKDDPPRIEWKAPDRLTTTGRAVTIWSLACIPLLLGCGTYLTIHHIDKGDWPIRVLMYGFTLVLHAVFVVQPLFVRRGYALTPLGAVARRSGEMRFVEWEDVRNVVFKPSSITLDVDKRWWDRPVLVLPHGPELRTQIVAEIQARRQEVIHRRVAELA